MTFQWPLLLLSLLLIPLLMGLYVLVQWRRQRYAVRFTNLALLKDVVGRGPGIRRHIPAVLFLLGLAPLLISLARPQAVIRVPSDQAAVMLVLDVSGSMAADDLKPNRMEAAKSAAKAFVDQVPEGTLMGLVSFSTNAAVNAPLTRDRGQVLRAIDGLKAEGGTAIGEGLHLALDQLEQRPPTVEGKEASAFVVLMSDGQSQQGRPPEGATQRALDKQIPVFTVGVGKRGARPMVQGRIPVQLDEATLQQIASRTGAEYYYAEETQSLERIYRDLGAQVSWVEEFTEVTALFSAAGTAFILLGGLLSLLWFNRLP